MRTFEYDGISWGSRILIFLKIRNTPKFKVGDWIKDISLQDYKQECEVSRITSDTLFCHYGYEYIVRDYFGKDYVESYIYEKNAERISPRFFETPYDPKQMGDREDDI